MGTSISNLLTRFSGHKEFRILMIGLDDAGKTTILYQLKLHKPVMIIPTIGFNVESVTYKNIQFLVWDIGGQERMRLLWHHYFENTDAVIFVVDSSNMDRFESAKEELHRVLNDDHLRNATFLILSNKKDLPNAVEDSELIDKLDLYLIRGRNWYIQNSCGMNGEGIHEGLEWLSNAMTYRNN